MGEVTFTLPEAPPEDYLRLVQWWRDASRFMSSAVTLGASRSRTRGIDPVLDMVDFEVPERLETQARTALAEGSATVAPTVRLEPAAAAQARTRVRRRMAWLLEMAERGGPSIEPRLMSLLSATQATSDETLRAAGFELEEN